VGPNVLNKLGSKLNRLSLYPIKRTVEVEPQGKPPKGKYALTKSKIPINPIRIKKLLLVLIDIYLNIFPSEP
jgi:hypothetical protein